MRQGRDTFRRVDVAAIIDGSQFLLDNAAYRVICLNSAAASAWWGEGTRWCTTGAGWFDGYRTYGELIFIEDRKKEGRWQLYLHNCEFRNTRNRRVNGQVFARTHPPVIDTLRERIIRDARASVFFGLMPDGAEIEHSLDLRRLPIERLPKGLKVRDDLDLRATGITVLPEGLSVGGHLLLSSRATPVFQSDPDVGGRIVLCDRAGIVRDPHPRTVSDPRQPNH